MQAQPDYARLASSATDAALGEDPALDEPSRDHARRRSVYNGNCVLQYFAITAAWAGVRLP